MSAFSAFSLSSLCHCQISLNQSTAKEQKDLGYNFDADLGTFAQARKVELRLIREALRGNPIEISTLSSTMSCRGERRVKIPV
jgi:hypothetical protein